MRDSYETKTLFQRCKGSTTELRFLNEDVIVHSFANTQKNTLRAEVIVTAYAPDGSQWHARRKIKLKLEQRK